MKKSILPPKINNLTHNFPYLLLKLPANQDEISLQLPSSINSSEQNDCFKIPFCQKCHKCIQKKTIVMISLPEMSQKLASHISGKTPQFYEHIQKNISLKDQRNLMFQYCVMCFAELIPQIIKLCQKMIKNWSYTIKSNLEYPIASGNWSAFYELVFLSILQKYGYDWKKVEEYMKYFGASYRSQQLQIHYQLVYCGNYKPECVKFRQSFIEKRRKNPQVHFSIKKNPYELSVLSSYTSEDQSISDNYILQMYKKQSFNLVLSSQKKNLQDYISEFEFQEKSQNFNTLFQEQQNQLKYEIISKYNQCLKIRQEKFKCILRFQQIILQKDSSQFQNEQISMKNMIGKVKDIERIYKNLFPTKIDELIFSNQKDALKLSEGLMRYLQKQDFFTITQSINFCLRIKNLIANLQKISKFQSNVRKRLKYNVIKLLDNKQDDEDVQLSPRKRRKVQKRVRDKQQEGEKDNLFELGFDSMDDYRSYLRNLKGNFVKSSTNKNFTIKRLNNF